MRVIDLNADVGEGAAGDDALLGAVTSASVACGFHAGDPETMHATVSAAVARGVVVGAHPGYPDRDGFGRRDLDRPPARIAEDVLYQTGALDGVARACGTAVRYVKPHGALYHRMDSDEACARAIAGAVRAYGDLVLVVPAGSAAGTVAEALGVTVAAEAFADRGYLDDGRLARRGTPGALLTDPDEVAGRAVALAVHGEVRTVTGARIEVRAATICLHGDTPGAAGLATRVRDALGAAGIGLRPFVA
jgi:UPF0271 protein